MTQNHKGAFFAALSGLFYGLIGYFGMNVIHAEISASTMLFWRFCVSAVFILFLMGTSFKLVKHLSKNSFLVFLYGMALYGPTSIFYFISAQYIGSGLAMVIFFTYPALIMFIEIIFYGGKINGRYVLALLIIFLGMLCLVNGSAIQFHTMGLFMGLLSALLYAFYFIASKNNPLSPLLSSLWVSLGAAMASLLAALLSHSFSLPTEGAIWFHILGIGIVCTALPIALLLKGLTCISSLQASLLSVLEPVFVVFFGILLLGERINVLQTIGICIILSGALLSLLNKRNEPSRAIDTLAYLENHSEGTR